MKTKIQYTNELLGRIRIIKDFLPPPESLVFKESTTKVTPGRRRRIKKDLSR